MAPYIILELIIPVALSSDSCPAKITLVTFRLYKKIFLLTMGHGYFSLFTSWDIIIYLVMVLIQMNRKH